MNPRTRGKGHLYLAVPLALLFLFQSGHAQDNNLNAMFLQRPEGDRRRSRGGGRTTTGRLRCSSGT